MHHDILDVPGVGSNFIHWVHPIIFFRPQSTTVITTKISTIETLPFPCYHLLIMLTKEQKADLWKIIEIHLHYENDKMENDMNRMAAIKKYCADNFIDIERAWSEIERMIVLAFEMSENAMH